MGFAASLKANINKALLNVNTHCYKIAKELFTNVVYETPSPTTPGNWAKGLLANQWYPKNGGNFSTEVSTDTSPFGGASLTRIQALSGLEMFKKDGQITMANNLEYAGRAESLGWPKPEWTGTVGPYRMVAKSIQLIAHKYK